MQTASAKWLPAIFFTIKKILGPNPDPAGAWAQCGATIRTAERCRNTAGMHIHVETLKSFWAVYPFRGHLERAGAHPSCTWAEAGSTPRWVANSSCEHLGFGKLTQGYLSSAVKVFGHLPPLPEHCPSIRLRWGWNQQPSASQSSPQQNEQPPPLTLGYKSEEKHWLDSKTTLGVYSLEYFLRWVLVVTMATKGQAGQVWSLGFTALYLHLLVQINVKTRGLKHSLRKLKWPIINKTK